MSAFRNYNIQIKGRVQDIGFRNLVENIAKSLNLRGMVYNDVDGTVKIVCSGAVSSVKTLLKELEEKSVNVGAAIDEIARDEIPGRVDFPPLFFKAPSDELGDIGRKLDVGVASIQRIEDNTGGLLKSSDAILDNTRGLVKSSDAILEGQDSLIKGQDSLIKGQDSLIKGQDSLIKGQDSLIKGQDSLIKGQDSLIKGQGSLIKGQGRQEGILMDISESLRQIVKKL